MGRVLSKAEQGKERVELAWAGRGNAVKYYVGPGKVRQGWAWQKGAEQGQGTMERNRGEGERE